MFRQLEGDSAVILSGGVYRLCDIYTRDDELYAKIGTGFVRLYANGGTSKAGLSLERLVTDQPLSRDQFGRLFASKPSDKRRALDTTPGFIALSSE